MSSCPDRAVLRRRWVALGLALFAAGAFAQAPSPAYPGIGRAATPKEVAAWDIDVRPDFKGLPKGSGSVAKGQDVWEAKCASCHGVFGESNEVFAPLVGGTTADDVKTGRVARLNDRAFPGRTTLMKLSSLSTLWDYIHRAMPWSAPKSLSADEVYAVSAYMLNMADVVPADYVLSDTNMAQTQQRLPNRNGMTTDHGLWPGTGLGNGGKPDVKAVACMKDCGPEPKIGSSLPAHALNNHGNLADQQRLVGPQRGANTAKVSAADAGKAAAPAPASAPAPAKAAAPAAGDAAAALALAQRNACMACHAVDSKLVGPAFNDVAAKYAGRSDAQAYIAGKIKSGSQGAWGAVPMPPQPLPEQDAQTIAKWLAGLAPK